MTVLFTDVVDSTSLGAALDPEVMRAVMRRYFDTVRTIVERHGGTVEKLIGDAAMAAFGIPQQHEDDALRAVRAADELRQAITGLNADLEREHGVAIQIRTAINTGEVVSGDPSSGQPFATGNAINVAMKLHEAALPAEILLGPTTQRLVRESVATEPVEPVELGGSLGRLTAHRLVALADTAGRPTAGARRIRRSARTSSHGLGRPSSTRATERRSRVLTVLGDAGVGKSRLVKELASGLGDEATFVVGPVPLLRRRSDLPPSRRDRSPGCTEAPALDDRLAPGRRRGRGAGRGAAHRADRRDGGRRLDRRDLLGSPAPVRGARPGTTARGRARGRALGRADAARPGRVPGELDLGCPGARSLPRAPEPARGTRRAGVALHRRRRSSFTRSPRRSPGSSSPSSSARGSSRMRSRPGSWKPPRETPCSSSSCTPT